MIVKLSVSVETLLREVLSLNSAKRHSLLSLMLSSMLSSLESMGASGVGMQAAAHSAGRSIATLGLLYVSPSLTFFR